MATLIDTTTTVTEAPQRKFRLSKADHIAEVSLLLSSPISSYDIQKEDSTTIVVKHRQTLEERLKSTKNERQEIEAKFEAKLARMEHRIFDLNTQMHIVEVERQYEKDRILDLSTRLNDVEAKRQYEQDRILNLSTRLHIVEAERQYEKDMLLDWETKTQLAQGINDHYMFHERHIPEDVYNLLKAHRCAYLPYLLSVWAVFYGRYPASHLRPNLTSEQAEAYDGKAINLLNNDLGDSVEAVWDSIPEPDRNLMVSMYLSRPPERKVVVHLKPSFNEAIQVLASDQHLSQVEKKTAADYIPHLVDKHEVLLFNP